MRFVIFSILSINEPVDLMFFRPISVLYEKSLSSEVSVDSDIDYMTAVNFFVCLEVCAYLISNENPITSTDSLLLQKIHLIK